MPAGSERVSTAQACQERCAQSGACQAFTFSNASNLCLLYDLLPSFQSNTSFDSGVRQSTAPTATQSALVGNKGPFEIRRATEATGPYLYRKDVASIAQCEQACRENDKCRIFSYGTAANNSLGCFLYDDAKANLIKNDKYDTGIRP
jgi:hypothetical protein